MRPGNPFRLYDEAQQFSKLCGAIFLLLLILAAGEGSVLWLAGFRYQSKKALHEACIGSFAVSADGRWAVTRAGFRENDVESRLECDVVWHDLRDSTATRLHVGHLSPEVVAISPLSGTLAYGCADGSVYLGRPGQREAAGTEAPPAGQYLLGCLRGGPVLNLAFSPDDRFLAAADRHHFYIWRARTGELVHRRAHGAGSYAIVNFSDHGNLVVGSGGAATELCLWDVQTGRTRKTLRYDSPLAAAVVSPNGKELAAIDVDCGLSVRNIRTGKLQWRQMRRGSDGLGLAYTRDGAEIGAGGTSGQICFFDAVTGDRRAPLTQTVSIKGLVIAPNGLLYSWDRGGDIRAWNIEHRQTIYGFSLLAWGRGERQAAIAGPVFRGGVLASVATAASSRRSRGD